jgi:hypothetical protein
MHVKGRDTPRTFPKSSAVSSKSPLGDLSTVLMSVPSLHTQQWQYLSVIKYTLVLCADADNGMAHLVTLIN